MTQDRTRVKKLHAIIPAGGPGSRLWPLSQAQRPKFLLDLAGSGQCLLVDTLTRLNPLSKSCTIVTGAHLVGGVQAALADQLKAAGTDHSDIETIAEPSGRDSMAAIGLASAILHRRHGNVVAGSFAADHIIYSQEVFHEQLERAIRAAEQGYLVTLGITPNYPATCFGYIEQGHPLPNLPGVFQAPRFIEKPNQNRAADLVRGGHSFWNAGMFVFQTGQLLDWLSQLHPRLWADLNVIAQAWDSDKRAEVCEKHWKKIAPIAIDYALAEPLAALGKVALVATPADMGWDDLGDFAALARLHAARLGQEELNATQADPAGANAAPILLQDSPQAFVYRQDMSETIAVLGIPNAIVVRTKDATLVTDSAHAQEVKTLVDQLHRLDNK